MLARVPGAVSVRYALAGVAVLIVCPLAGLIAATTLSWPFHDFAEGELRCEGRGALVIRVAGKDYAVNGLAGGRYPPIQNIWNTATYPEANIDRIVVEGLTLCDW